MVGGNVGILGRDLLKDLVPEYHRIVEGVALADGGDALALFLSQFEGISDNALGALAREYASLKGHLGGGVFKQPFARAGILALAVFADHDHVDISGVYVLEGAGRAAEELYGAEVDILVKAVADLKQEAPQRNMVGHSGIADSAEIDGVEL